MSIVELLGEIADTIKRSGTNPAPQYGPVQQFHTTGRPPAEEPHMIEGITSVTEKILATSGRIASLASGVVGTPILESIETGVDIFAPASHDVPMGLSKIVHGIQTKNAEMVAVGTESVLTIGASGVSAILHLQGIPAGAQMAPGVSLATSIIALIDGVHWLYHTYGSEIAAKTLFALLVQDTAGLPATQTSLMQSGVSLKLNYYKNLNPLIASLCWVVYKYNPDWLTKARTVINRIGLPMLGLATAIITIISIATSVASLGIVPIVLGTFASSVALGFVVYRGIKYWDSREKFRKEILPHLSDDQRSELYHCLTGTHAAFGATIGDFFRYQIAILLYEQWRKGYLDSPDLVPHLPSNIPTKPIRSNFRVTEAAEYAAQLSSFIVSSLGIATWHVIVSHLGKRDAAGLLESAREEFKKRENSPKELLDLFPSSDAAHKARLHVIRLFFAALPINRTE